MNTVRKIASVSIILGLLAGAGAGQAADMTWQGGDGAWEAAANRVSNDDPPENRVPEEGDRVLVVTQAGTARVSTETGRVPATGSLELRIRGADGAVIQTGGEVHLIRTTWIGDAGGGTYELQGGLFTTGSTIMISGLNQGNQLGYFIVSGGTATANAFTMNYKGTGSAYIEVRDGELNVSGTINMACTLSGTPTTSRFTQSGGVATIGNFVMGQKAGLITQGGSSVVKLDGGTLTITNATPFVFYQPGAPVYVDFNGGTLNLRGTWDFASLTGIANSDFRAKGEAATADSLVFTAVDIGGVAYTAISAKEPPKGTVVILR